MIGMLTNLLTAFPFLQYCIAKSRVLQTLPSERGAGQVVLALTVAMFFLLLFSPSVNCMNCL